RVLFHRRSLAVGSPVLESAVWTLQSSVARLAACRRVYRVVSASCSLALQIASVVAPLPERLLPPSPPPLSPLSIVRPAQIRGGLVPPSPARFRRRSRATGSPVPESAVWILRSPVARLPACRRVHRVVSASYPLALQIVWFAQSLAEGPPPPSR